MRKLYLFLFSLLIYIFLLIKCRAEYPINPAYYPDLSHCENVGKKIEPPRKSKAYILKKILQGLGIAILVMTSVSLISENVALRTLINERDRNESLLDYAEERWIRDRDAHSKKLDELKSLVEKIAQNSPNK
ncbi:hypothetical protein PRELSG_1417650 [Plasmodium relictum]|uniref:Fam-g protein n=1 Tax=Plasmodium relictum TaxID=85471 RepID=A0A1J1HBW5_PLARL|nr:hypothetical protein PRELSG_1417650 [Plasmodium relictum]CRH02448.1 hypothetical protein PRELSG_1417650 [Plasmodium relictum]